MSDERTQPGFDIGQCLAAALIALSWVLGLATVIGDLS